MELTKEIYPKTERVKNEGLSILVSEKIDGQNLGLFVNKGELFIITRNTIMDFKSMSPEKVQTYKGLYNWLLKHEIELIDSLYEQSIIFGEWVGESFHYKKLGYCFLAFAKARINDEFKVNKFNWDLDLLKYVFNKQEFPIFISKAPIVARINVVPSIEFLDHMYEEYCQKVDRKVEGFILNFGNSIQKYVRMKRGKVVPHQQNSHKSEVI